MTANAEHLAILKRGVAAWNEWRTFRELGQIFYQPVNLEEADLSNWDLQNIDFYHANLQRANLVGAILTGAQLRDADLRGANLTEAHLESADMVSTKLSQANLTNAFIGATTFGGVDLSGVLGIELLKHVRPSYISIDTLYISKGNIPVSFLRGCGVPEPIIALSKSLVGKPNQFYSVFISYSRKDQEFAERLYSDLQDNQVRVWFAPEDMKTGARIRDTLYEAARLSDKLLLILSENSINSEWVEDEVESAYEKERQMREGGQPNPTVLFPVRLDDAMKNTSKAWAAKLRQQRHITDFSQWRDHVQYKKALDRLLRDLKTESKDAGS